MTEADLKERLKALVGNSQLLTRRGKTAYYRSGFRSGKGEAVAVVFPGSLLQQWQALQVCVEAGCAIIMQAAKTGLTEGSCPSGDDYDLGIHGLGDTPEEIFGKLERGDFDAADLEQWDTPASDRHYAERIRDMHSGTPNRFNADPRRLHDVSGSAGKVAAFAVRVDTYPLPKRTQVFYLGADNPQHFAGLRKDVLTQFKHLPEMCEYMNRDIFDVAAKYGKDVFLSIKHLGTKRLPKAYALKAAMEYRLNKIPFLPRFLPDIALQGDDPDWVEELPEEITRDLVMALYYGHFMCHVFHQDYIFKKGTDIEAVKAKMVKCLEARGAKLPAEHNVGHMYQAEPVLKDFYDKLDPTNTFNPGIGKQSKAAKPSPFR